MVHVLELSNGLTVLADEVPYHRTVAFSLALPCGCRDETIDKLGLAGVVCEMVQRGAGPRDSRAVMGQLDLLGVDRSATVSSPHTNFCAAMPAESLATALAIYADIVRTPHMPSDQLEDALRGSLLELQSSTDDLAGRVFRELKLLHYGDPIGRDALGTFTGLASITLDDVRQFFEAKYQPRGAVLAIAGRFHWSELQPLIERLFGDWQPGSPVPTPTLAGISGYRHIEHPSQQTHIAFALPVIPYRHVRQMEMQAAVGILGSGVSSRLFTQVREERGLCYTISASYASALEIGTAMVYAGTTSARAQETLDVTWEQLLAIRDSITTDEVERLKVRLSSTVMLEQEATVSRAIAMISDWYHLGRVVPTAELLAEIDALTPEPVMELWQSHFPNTPTMVTLGPDPLTPPYPLNALPPSPSSTSQIADSMETAESHNRTEPSHH